VSFRAIFLSSPFSLSLVFSFRLVVLAFVVGLSGVLAESALPPGNHTLYITGRPEGTRKFMVHVPESYRTAKDGSVPVVFAWHGYTEGCVFFELYTGFSNYSDQFGLIAVYPCGTGVLASFNAGICCGSNKNDDVEFARLMLLRIKQEWPKINPNAVFSTGFSNGGMMSELLACRMPTTFRAIASVGGTMVVSPGGQQGMANCDDTYGKAVNASRQVAVLKIHATADLIVPYNGDRSWPGVVEDNKRWAQRTKCTGTPKQTWKTQHYHNSIYESCPGGPVELVTWEGGLHWWPGGYLQNVTGFLATDYIWNFFKQYT